MTEQTTLAILNEYPAEKYNVLAPATVTQVTPWHRITVAQVKTDLDDTYAAKDGKRALKKAAILSLADAAGVRFRPTRFTRDEDGSYDAYSVAEKQDPDGTWRQYPGSYRWDVTERLAEIKNPNTPSGIEEAKMIRKFSMQRAESGAMLRAVRNILQIEQAYAPKDLEKPFIVARVTFNPWDDPQVKGLFAQALAAQLAGNVAMLRGPQTDDPFGSDMNASEQQQRALIAQGKQASRALRLMGADAPTDEDDSSLADIFEEEQPEDEREEPLPLEPDETENLIETIRAQCWLTTKEGELVRDYGADVAPITPKTRKEVVNFLSSLFDNDTETIKLFLKKVFDILNTASLAEKEGKALLTVLAEEDGKPKEWAKEGVKRIAGEATK